MNIQIDPNHKGIHFQILLGAHVFLLKFEKQEGILKLNTDKQNQTGQQGVDYSLNFQQGYNWIPLVLVVAIKLFQQLSFGILNFLYLYLENFSSPLFIGNTMIQISLPFFLLLFLRLLKKRCRKAPPKALRADVLKEYFYPGSKSWLNHLLEGQIQPNALPFIGQDWKKFLGQLIFYFKFIKLPQQRHNSIHRSDEQKEQERAARGRYFNLLQQYKCKMDEQKAHFGLYSPL
ncbi:hypothetical protein ABPG72_020010 [Tetrahymena utriculariae]